MNQELKEYKTKLGQLSINEQKLRDLHLRKLSLGEIQGPLTGYATIDKPWLKYYENETIKNDLPSNTIYEYLRDKNSQDPNRIAIEYFGNKLTYKELLIKIDECAKSLTQMGVKKGDIVTICMPTTPEMVFLFYALSKIGAISNMIDPRKSPEEIEEYASEVHSKIFVSIDVAGEKIKNLKKNTEVEHIIIATPYESFKSPLKQILKFKDKAQAKEKRFVDTKECYNWSQFIKLGKDISCVEEVKYTSDMPVVIVHTGGTTGKAKGVVLSNDNINRCAHQCEFSGLDFKDRGTWLDIMPPFIVYGVGNGLHLPLSMGMKVILMPTFDPTKYDDIILKYKPNYMAGVPSHYGYLLNSKKLKDTDLSFIKTPIVGGDKMDYTLEKDVNEFFKKHNCSSKIIKGYGMSEVDAAVSVCITNEVNKLKSVGIPLSHTNMGVFDPETNDELTYNSEGEVRITGPNVMIGYYQNQEEENKVLHKDTNGNKWIHSGDLGYFDKDGNLFVHGRYKEMIIRPDGFKVYPSSIEEVILKHNSVQECKVVGCRDYTERQGELPKAFIILKENTSKQNKVLEEIKELCNTHLAEYSLPYEYEVRTFFPVTSIGKIDTKTLKEETETKSKSQIKVLKKK